MIADHAKDELLDPRSAFQLGARQRARDGARQRWGVAMMPMFVPVLSPLMTLVRFSFVSMAGELLMHVP